MRIKAVIVTTDNIQNNNVRMTLKVDKRGKMIFYGEDERKSMFKKKRGRISLKDTCL